MVFYKCRAGNRGFMKRDELLSLLHLLFPILGLRSLTQRKRWPFWTGDRQGLCILCILLEHEASQTEDHLMINRLPGFNWGAVCHGG